MAEWSAVATVEERRRAAELLRTLDDGSWDERWWWEPVTFSPEVVEVRIDSRIPRLHDDLR